MIAVCWSFGSESKTCLDISSGSNTKKKPLLRPVVRLLAISSSRNEIRLVEVVMATSIVPVCIAA